MIDQPDQEDGAFFTAPACGSDLNHQVWPACGLHANEDGGLSADQPVPGTGLLAKRV